jgi:hypothetical protein
MSASTPLTEVPPMNPQLLPATARDDVPAWQQTVVAFLAEKQRRLGSRRSAARRRRTVAACPAWTMPSGGRPPWVATNSKPGPSW